MNHDLELASALKSSLELAGVTIRPDLAEQGDGPPYVVFAEIALPEGTYILSGESSLTPSRYQIDIFAATRLEANALAQAVTSKLEEVFSAVVLNSQSLFETDTRLRRVLLDLYIWFVNA